MDKKHIFVPLMICLVLYNSAITHASTFSTVSGWMSEFGKSIAPLFGVLGAFILFPVGFAFFRKLLSVPMQIVGGIVMTALMFVIPSVLPWGIGSAYRTMLDRIVGRLPGG